MKINYNDTFYEQHRYLKGKRDGVESYNDTKWVNINDRYRILNDLSSSLLDEQPFNVIGNVRGFEKLLDLINRSNYTYADIDKALIDTYNMSLKNAMTKMVVNTQAIIYKCNTSDKKVVIDNTDNFYEIDVPFNQLHFGSRDEFIRRHISLMNNTDYDNFVTMEQFTDSEISSVLGFTMLGVVNGLICNNFKVAINDKGFRFKIYYPYSTDAEIIIYRLDTSAVFKTKAKATTIATSTIPYSHFDESAKTFIGKKCLVNIFNGGYTNNTTVVPNFGTFNSTGLVINNLQNKTKADINNTNKDITIVVYVLKYLHEVPNLYPAVNYYDIMNIQKVYTDTYSNVKDFDSKQIYASDADYNNNLEVCTPPISLDRSTTASFQTILNGLNIYDSLMVYEDVFKNVGYALMKPMTVSSYDDNIKNPLLNIYYKLKYLYTLYVEVGVITSLLPSESIDKFKNVIDSVGSICMVQNIADIQLYSIDEYYGENYKFFVNAITTPLNSTRLINFSNMKDLSPNFYSDTTNLCFNRPVSEQSFISLVYNNEIDSWVFSAPDIKHFCGISNTFYIDSNLKGDELYKFFVLYSETDNPSELTVEPLEFNTVFDFDKFSKQVDKHHGYIRYWNAENKLLKISNILYNKYNDDTVVQVLSKILKNKVDSPEILKDYPCDINYETSNITSDNYLNYDENSERGPFSINFLFYTLSSLRDNPNKLMTYFMHRLSEDKFINRYTDYDVSKLILDNQISYPVNYTEYSISPNIIDLSKSEIPTEVDKCYTFYGIPVMINSAGNSLNDNLYRYTFNNYESDLKYNMCEDAKLSDTYYIKPNPNSDLVVSYKDDITLCESVVKYLNIYQEYMSILQTNYTTTDFNINVINNFKDAVENIVGDIKTLNLKQHTFHHDSSSDIVNLILTENMLLSKINTMSTCITNINTCYVNNRKMDMITYVNSIISALKSVYYNMGIDNCATGRVRHFYIHLKLINTPMNCYKFRNWLNGFDLDLLSKLDSVLANNHDYSLDTGLFKNFYNNMNRYIPTATGYIDTLESTINGLNIGELKTNHISPIVNFCKDIIANYMFDLFIIDNIRYDKNKTYATKPKLVTVTLDLDSHITPPIGVSIINANTILLQPVTDMVGSNYVIKSLTKMCEYTFFNGESINNITMKILDDSNNVITTSSISIDFIKIGNMSNAMNTFNQIPNVQTTVLDFQNRYDKLSIDSNGNVVSEQLLSMNYELMLGNHFEQLSNIHEYVIDKISTPTGPIDRIHLENQTINNYMNREYAIDSNKIMYFKPSQISHVVLNEDGSTNSVCGKYFVGQTLYLKTDDGLSVFPVTVTAISNSINSGFIEAEVDSYNAEWFKTDEDSVISKYLDNEIECSVIPDNICNFLNEFSNDDYSYFVNMNQDRDTSDTLISLPGDPIYVSNNTEYVYNRLNWMFNDLIDNRFIDEEHKQYNFIYIGNGFINDITSDTMTINMLDYNFNNLTISELYPILRKDTDCDDVRKSEVATFTEYKKQTDLEVQNLSVEYLELFAKLKTAENEAERKEIIFALDSVKYGILSKTDFSDKMLSLITHPELSTMWTNTISYDQALTYISTGKTTITSISYMDNIRNIPFDDKLEVFLYDWEHKLWLNPKTYGVTKNIVNLTKFDNQPADFTTNNVLTSITITPNEDFINSNKILIYLGYNKSDIFNDITLGENKCFCRFKPILTLPRPETINPYSNIHVRQHFDGEEKYIFDTFNKPEDFSITNSYHVTRPKRSDRYDRTPVLCKRDISLLNNNTSYDHTHLDMYIRMPFNDIETPATSHIQNFTAIVNQPIEEFVEDQVIKVICVQDNDMVEYNGNISPTMFTCKTSLVNGTQTLTVLESSIPEDVSSTYICTVMKDNRYKMYSGIITITSITTTLDLIDSMNGWIKTTDSLKELPEEFVIVPHDDIIITGSTSIICSNIHEISSNDVIDNTDDESNLYKYYVDNVNKFRLPVSDTRYGQYNKRLIIDQNLNPNIEIVKTTYIHVCRYSRQTIPENGFVDLIGYIPTPLSRDRYEIWVNGRLITDELTILSPTSFQLSNLKSLRNLEVLELVEDVNDSILMNRHISYIGLNGRVYNSYIEALKDNSICQQNICYGFNSDNKCSSENEFISIISNPNNIDIEKDILSNISFDEIVTDYNQITGIPQLNGIPLYHTTMSMLGMTEIPYANIIKSLDNVWKKERLTNRCCELSHVNSNISNTVQLIYAKHPENITPSDSIVLYIIGNTTDSFSLYITNNENDSIDDVNNTIAIIPFMRTGIYVILDKKYIDKWIHTTLPDSHAIILKK